MPLDIPYTFIAGTKAKASEVNSNFNAVKTLVDANEVNIAQNELDIQNLEQNKADLNGAIEERFQVANPNNDYDAVNKQYFDSMTANIKPYINGFKLSKYDNTTISATPGSCWDSTYEYFFSSATAMQVSQSNLGQNATYYVYITGGGTAEANELIISSSDTTPELPTGAEYFRLLGSFTTDGNGNIKDVLSNSNTVTEEDIVKATDKAPNYNAPSEIGSGHVCTADGWINWQPNVSGIRSVSLAINGRTIGYASNSRTDRTTRFGYMYKVKAGDRITANWGPIYFHPDR